MQHQLINFLQTSSKNPLSRSSPRFRFTDLTRAPLIFALSGKSQARFFNPPFCQDSALDKTKPNLPKISYTHPRPQTGKTEAKDPNLELKRSFTFGRQQSAVSEGVESTASTAASSETIPLILRGDSCCGDDDEGSLPWRRRSGERGRERDCGRSREKLKPN